MVMPVMTDLFKICSKTVCEIVENKSTLFCNHKFYELKIPHDVGLSQLGKFHLPLEQP